MPNGPFDETRPIPTRQPVSAGRFGSRELVLKSKSHHWPARREFVRLPHAAHRPPFRPGSAIASTAPCPASGRDTALPGRTSLGRERPTHRHAPEDATGRLPRPITHRAGLQGRGFLSLGSRKAGRPAASKPGRGAGRRQRAARRDHERGTRSGGTRGSPQRPLPWRASRRADEEFNVPTRADA